MGILSIAMLIARLYKVVYPLAMLEDDSYGCSWMSNLCDDKDSLCCLCSFVWVWVWFGLG